MKLKTLAAASVVALTAFSSQAASWNWGDHAALELGGTTVSSGAIFDTYSFSLAADSTVSSGVLAFGTIVGGAYSLYSTGLDGVIGGGDDVGVGAWTFNSGVHSASLDAGSYYYTVLGGAIGSASYAIASSVTAAPVPEPETYALLGAGLGIVGFVASRRRRDY